ncbi:50S ribosomal protein L15 [Borrelia hermsii]|uniref:Large ribosomal subunit protein uL15 n=3 Tax=Borrelia hermsii TaxID=140 RepID=A0AAN0X582_BORHE|nr:50S ribosomal protein L15 [Borrelia hermsii]AAX17006.1 LSU ribosomal protein L15P [Borrelia hermsii DAH]AHH12520.1 LSU ribosomal protein L15P [Borrelia hermsii YBT]AJW73298.1 50S ribosomal protein L15 [Borrelia hermsii CC1]AMR75349.1 50S ribosomal protein L15 [Borrelia hermsii]ANA43304.1 50S ribosomal protein L15 [Borrelia hermsii HS1]
MVKLRRPSGANKSRKIVGRGPGSGLGKTSGRGQKGQKARNSSPRIGFEGGQTPLYRRLPRRGFSNHDYKVKYEIVGLGDIDRKFETGDLVNYSTLLEKGLVGKNKKKIKILANGGLTKKVNFEVTRISKSAEELATKIGCSIKLL